MASENLWTVLETAVHTPSHLKESQQPSLCKYPRCAKLIMLLFVYMCDQQKCVITVSSQTHKDTFYVFILLGLSPCPWGCCSLLMFKHREKKERKGWAKNTLKDKHFFSCHWSSISFSWHIQKPFSAFLNLSFILSYVVCSYLTEMIECEKLHLWKNIGLFSSFFEFFFSQEIIRSHSSLILLKVSVC